MGSQRKKTGKPSADILLLDHMKESQALQQSYSRHSTREYKNIIMPVVFLFLYAIKIMF